MNEKDSLEFLKKTLDDLFPWDKLPPQLKESMLEYVTFRRELSKESDRGCALLAAAHLDFMLESLLRKKLIGTKAHLDNLFSYSGPVGSFSSRTLLAYSIGLISSDCLNDIQIIRKIRNDFGHTPAIISFEDQKMKSLCNNLKLNVHESSVRPRHQFLNSVSGISGQIEAAQMNCLPFEEATNLDLKERKEDFLKVFKEFQKIIDTDK